MLARMAEIELTATTLIVHIRGADQFFALKSKLEVPLKHIAGIDVRPPDAGQIWHGLRVGGSNLPGVITAGRYLHLGQWGFWNGHVTDKAIGIGLHDQRYGKLVVGVDAPDATAEAITAAISAS